ncbi:hypothetical protein ZWY2020_045293 [Hordeum vulgare]|nr:hypothetical protein ZWY2020_045293 [Hordeum vulgare]
MDHYNNPRNVGTFDKDDTDVSIGLVDTFACRDVMNMQIHVEQARDRIVDANFKSIGCGSAITSSFAREQTKSSLSIFPLLASPLYIPLW